MSLGCPYQGSKSSIAWSIIKQLPEGKRFVDLFGGGGSMTQCAAISSKYDSVMYNDYNKLTMEYVKKAINGEYTLKRGLKFVSRNEFKTNKDKDPYIKYCWSFANNGLRYMFNDFKEPIKKELWEFIVNGKRSQHIKIPMKYKHLFRTSDPHKRRVALIYVFKLIQHKWLPLISPYEPVIRLERLQRMSALKDKDIKFFCFDYKDYKYKKGDIVYCDPPYEDTEQYNDNMFNSKEFYDWVYNADFPIYFSSYRIRDNRFKLVYAKAKRRAYNDSGINKTKAVECLYANEKGQELLCK